MYISQGSQKSSFKQSIIHYINELQHYNETTLNNCYILKMAVRVKYQFFTKYIRICNKYLVTLIYISRSVQMLS